MWLGELIIITLDPQLKFSENKCIILVSMCTSYSMQQTISRNCSEFFFWSNCVMILQLNSSFQLFLLELFHDFELRVTKHLLVQNQHRKRCEIISKLTLNTPETGSLIVSCEHASYLFLVFLLLT